jgi:beta-glucosidase
MNLEQTGTIARSAFPGNFVWGVATAAYQVEGATHEDGRGPSIWDIFSHTLGKIQDGSTGDVACDHYHRYQQDVELIQSLGVNSYRFSISWPRVLPTGRGTINEKGLDFYDRLVDELLRKQIEPAATLYHWDLPQALYEKGGWQVRSTAQAFAEYTEIMVRRLGDRVKQWITLNEPWVSSVLGYQTGEHAPGERNLGAAVRTAHHLLLAHGLAMPIIRTYATRPDMECGITLNLDQIEPSQDTEQARAGAASYEAFLNGWFMDPIFKGKYPDALIPDFAPHLTIEAHDWETITAPIDFLGINYYRRTLVQERLADTEIGPKGYIFTHEPGSQYTDMDWEICPQGLYHLLTSVQQEYKPPKIYITENGAAFTDHVEQENGASVIHDPDRSHYVQTHIAAIHQAIEAGVPMAGYFVWSLMDNFEWGLGYSRRFGIVYVDYPTQQRLLKDSGRWYQQFLSGNVSAQVK